MFARRLLLRQSQTFSKRLTTQSTVTIPRNEDIPNATEIDPAHKQNNNQHNQKKPPKDNDEIPSWFLLSFVIMPAIGASVGVIQGSYEYYSKDDYYHNRTQYLVLDYTFYSLVWPLYIPYGICQGIGYLLAKQPIRIHLKKDQK